MFLGSHSPKLDEKGRLILPAKFRDDLMEGLVIAPFHERCLAMWPAAAFEELVQGVRGSSANQQVRDYQRMLAARAFPQTPDKQGRITLSTELREYAGLERDCVVIGAVDRVEVWSPAAWRTYEASKESAFADMNEGAFPSL